MKYFVDPWHFCFGMFAYREKWGCGRNCTNFCQVFNSFFWTWFSSTFSFWPPLTYYNSHLLPKRVSPTTLSCFYRFPKMDKLHRRRSNIAITASPPHRGSRWCFFFYFWRNRECRRFIWSMATQYISRTTRRLGLPCRRTRCATWFGWCFETKRCEHLGFPLGGTLGRRYGPRERRRHEDGSTRYRPCVKTMALPGN